MSLQSEVIAAAAPRNVLTGAAPVRGVHAGTGPIRISARSATLLAAPVTVIATMLVGCVVLTVAGLPLFANEMISGGVINLVGGMLAAVAILSMMGQGTVGVAQAGIIGIALRCGTVLMGILLAQSLPLGFDKTVLVYWSIGFYFPMLIVESALIAWLSSHLAD